MKRYVLIFVSLILFISIVSCSKKSNSDMPVEAISFGGSDFPEVFLNPENVDEITVLIGGEGAEKVVFKEKVNIIEAINIIKELREYKPNDFKCEAQDVSFHIKVHDGSIKRLDFKRIKPIENYFSNILNSLEYKRQSLSIFKVKKEDIQRVKFESSKKVYAAESTDKRIIAASLDNVIKHYETTNYYNQDNFYSLGYAYFYDKSNKEIAKGLILRDDTQWNELYDKNSSIKKIKVNPEDISRIIVKDDKTGKEAIISDPDIKKKVLDTYYDGGTSESIITIQLDFAIKNTNNASLFGSYRKGEVPEFIVELLK
ncbi:MAG: hypothetical protein N2484_04275 [Clostridia bacterium]|nr:hypothetical protein [Clostridia bacterium]